MNYRHELKFLVSDAQLALLEYRLRPLLKQDVHQNGQAYKVRSLYFDDYWNSCLHENEEGTDGRKKYRIRIYNGEDSVIKLEKKMKNRQMSGKLNVKITKEDCMLYMGGKVPLLLENGSALEKDFYVQIKGNGMRPVCIVEYERKAFVERCGNVRVTFDRNISGCEKVSDFLKEKLLLTPLLPPGQHVLEVKYDELLPRHLAEVLEIGSLQRTSFSKYSYARKYKEM